MALKIFFGSLATDYIAQQGREIKDVAEAIGKTPSNQFSKWKTGKWTYIPEKKLARVIDEIARKDREKRVSLMIAYLIDMTPEAFRPLIDIGPKTGDDATDVGLAGRWSPNLRAKLEAIGAAYARDKDFMRMADQLGEWAVSINNRAEKG
jgi:hypothetical protein